MPQLVPLHVAVLFATDGHAEQDVPQLAVLVLLAHVPLQLWNPVLH
jgi:hypothetical protein